MLGVLCVFGVLQTRLAEYYDFLPIEERVALEAEIIRKCLSRTELQVAVEEHRCRVCVECFVLPSNATAVSTHLPSVCVRASPSVPSWSTVA